jgi:hypothetical protein
VVVWSFIEATAGSSCVAEIAVSSAKVAVVVLSDVGRSLELEGMWKETVSAQLKAPF